MSTASANAENDLSPPLDQYVRIFSMGNPRLHNLAQEAVSSWVTRRLEQQQDPLTIAFPIALNEIRRELSNLIRSGKRRETREQKAYQQQRTPPQSDRLPELIESIKEAIDSLPDTYGLPCKLKFLDELTYQEVAIACGISPATAFNRVAEGMVLLRERLRSLAVEFRKIPGLADSGGNEE